MQNEKINIIMLPILNDPERTKAQCPNYPQEIVRMPTSD